MTAATVPDPTVGGGSISDEPTFESRGIDYIPRAERKGRPIDLAWMWSGALFNVEYLVYGGLLTGSFKFAGFGLRFWQAAVIIILGNLSYIITGLGSLQGPKAGTAGFTINRAPFGPNGAKLIAALNWITQIGYEVVGLVLVVTATEALLAKIGVHHPTQTWIEILLVIAAAAIQLLLPLFGHGTMLRVLRLLTIPFVILFIVLTILTVGKAHLGAGTNAPFSLCAAAFTFVLSSGGYGWPMNANDFSRYLPETASDRRIVWSVALGGFIPTTLLMLLGAAIATAVPDATNATAFTSTFAGWFAWPYLIFVLIQVFAINSVDLYTSGLTLQAILPRIQRWQCVLLDTVIAGGLTAWTVFDSSFNTFLNDFVLFVFIWIAPWVPIYLIDYFLRRGRYDRPGLMDTARGIYYRNGGIHWPGVIAQAVGMIAAAAFLDTTVWVSPLSKATGGSDFSWAMGIIFGGGLYYLLARRSVPREADASSTLEPVT